MAKYVFVGDIHGKIEQVDRALEKEGTIIFVGDFIDSFDRPLTDHEECYATVIDAIDAGKARAIYGNHELSYLHGSHRCSGYNTRNAALFRKYYPWMEKRFESHIIIKQADQDIPILVTHAGLTKQLWDLHKLTIDNLDETLRGWWKDWQSPMHWIGKARGGFFPYGGPFWCDFNHEFEEVPELLQIFGHTAGQGIRQKGNSFCIDCLSNTQTFLELEIDESHSS